MPSATRDFTLPLGSVLQTPRSLLGPLPSGSLLRIASPISISGGRVAVAVVAEGGDVKMDKESVNIAVEVVPDDDEG